jgi:DNA sulfur modification protein DndB
MTESELVLPAIRGVQSGRDYFVTSCPLRLLANLLPDDDPGVFPGGDIRSALDETRVSEMARYVTSHPDSYVFSPLTASVDSTVRFEPDSKAEEPATTGHLRISVTARRVLLDGRYRFAALMAALERKPLLGGESIGIVLFVDPELKRSGQIYVDLKRNEQKLPRSRLLLHDNRDKLARVTRQMIRQVPVFDRATEMVRTTISNRSRKLFTLSAIHHATESLLKDRLEESIAELVRTASDYWKEVASCIPDWGSAANGQIAAAELRKGFVHAHGLALAALARVGRALLTERPKTWKRQLAALKTLDWSRSNAKLWDGRALIGQRVSKATTSVVLTGNAIKRHLGLNLTPDEKAVEAQSRKHVGT